MRNTVITYTILGLLGVTLLLFAFWALVPVSLSSSVKDGSTISPTLKQIIVRSNQPLSGSVTKTAVVEPASASTKALRSSLAGLSTRLVIRFTGQLTANTDYVITVSKKGWLRSDGVLTIHFHTNNQTFNAIQENGSENQGELNSNPILNQLPHDDQHFSVEWNISDDQNRYVLDVTVYVEPGQTPQQAVNLYGPSAASWIKSTGQPQGTYVIRYSTKPQSAHP